ncbi:lipase 3-like [Phymastichus coffea]|uniref:lipase 3-like n=1 Tax=Phymastichus coffea TaxID=108790 RepID=UPI00273BF506|nr:lipase 3-like [Phymastichus coffea]
MKKYFIIIFAIVCFSPQVLGFWKFIRKIIQNEDSNIVRVRTTKEMTERSAENAVLDFIGLVEQYKGYTAEEYQVTTHDGYILTLHRVSGSPSNPAASGKSVVYIGHGLFGSSDFFAILGPQQALLYMLADAGYDVWIGNFRGNTYSRRHVKYSVNSDNLKYWGFSMDELGLIDLPLFIDTVLEKTNKTKLSYIGYSMGNTLSAMLLSAKPEYNDKMHVVVSIAPVVLFTPPFSSLSRALLSLSVPAKILILSSQAYQILPQSKLIQTIGKDVCVKTSGQLLCNGFLNNIVHVNRMNTTYIPIILKYAPAGASYFMVDQYAQFLKTGEFRPYNFGFLRLSIRRDSLIPSKYDLTRVTSPQALFYSDSDVYSNVRDVETLSSIFPNVVALEKITNFNHLDYMWLDEDKEVLYNRVLEIIREQSNE